MKTSWSRRDFLKTATASLTFAASSPVLFAQKESLSKPRHLKKAIMLSTVGYKGTTLERFKAIKEAGFAGIEPLSHMPVEEVLAARDETGLEIPSVCAATHWKETLTDPNPGTRERGLEGLKQALNDAKAYGATSVLLVPGVVNEHVSYADAWTRSQAEIGKAIPLAEKLGVKIAVENVWNNFLLSPLEMARYVDEFKSPMVGVHFDIGNILRYGWPEHWITVLGKRILQLHIKEFSRKKMNGEGLGKGFQVEYLEGDNNWPSVMKALDDIGYNG